MYIFLNNKIIDAENAYISVMDRGFLFGDGVYEVIGCFSGKGLVGLDLHLKRLSNSLKTINISLPNFSWKEKISDVIEANTSEMGTTLGIYIQVSRGADNARNHIIKGDLQPTVLIMPVNLLPKPKERIFKGFEVTVREDKRWECNFIKSTSLLGNVMHKYQSYKDSREFSETILYRNNLLLEASSSNIFIVKGSIIATPKADEKILSGVTRWILIQCLLENGWKVEQRDIHIDEIYSADELWSTSSLTEILPIINIDGKSVGEGKVGEVFHDAYERYHACKFNSFALNGFCEYDFSWEK